MQRDPLCVHANMEDMEKLALPRRGLPPRLLDTNAHLNAVVSLCSGGKDALYTASGPTPRLWSASTGEEERHFKPTPWENGILVNCMAVADGLLFVGTARDRPLRAFAAKTGQTALAGKLAGHRASVTCLAVSSGLLYSGSSDRTVRVWHTATGDCVQVLEGHRDRINCVVVSKDRFVYSGSSDCTVRSWDAAAGAQLRVFGGHPNAVQCLALFEVGTGTGNAEDRLLFTGAFCVESSGEDSDVTDDNADDGGADAGAAEGGSGDSVGSACGDKTLRAFLVSTGALVRTLGGHTGTVWAMVVADCVLYISVGEPRSNRICAYHAQTGSLLRVLEEEQAGLPQQAARFWAVARWARCLLADSAGGRRRVLAGCSDGTVRAHAAVALVWSPGAHATLPVGCRRRVYTLLLIHARGTTRGGAVLPLWRLAPGVFFLILSMLPISGFARD